jgi:hypothetical protein
MSSAVRRRSRIKSTDEEDGHVLIPSTHAEAYVLGKHYVLDDTGRNLLSYHSQAFFRFTYRRDFAPLTPYTYTSDAGWGCMIRAAQMMMGHTLRRHYLGTGKVLRLYSVFVCVLAKLVNVLSAYPCA